MDLPEDSIFICYRRAQAADVTDRICERISEKFSDRSVFRDIKSVPVGENFRHVIREKLARCMFFLVIIDPQWVSVESVSGKRRIDIHDDDVRVEVELALQTPGVKVIPLLVAGASMPTAGQLPESIRALAALNGAKVRSDPEFNQDIEDVLRQIAQHARKGVRRSRGRAIGAVLLKLGFLATVSAVVAACLIYLKGNSRENKWDQCAKEAEHHGLPDEALMHRLRALKESETSERRQAASIGMEPLRRLANSFHHLTDIKHVSFADSDSKLITVSGEDAERLDLTANLTVVSVWELRKGQHAGRQDFLKGKIRDAYATTGGFLVLEGVGDRGAVLLDFATCEIKKFPNQIDKNQSVASVSANGGSLLVKNNNQWRTFDLLSNSWRGAAVPSFGDRGKLSPDGSHMAVLDQNQTQIHVYDVISGKLMGTPGNVDSRAWWSLGARGEWLLTSDEKGNARLKGVKTDLKFSSVRKSPAPLKSVAISNSGSLAAIASGNGDIQLMMPGIGVRQIIRGRNGERPLAFSHDDGRLLSVCDDHSVQVWDVAKGVPIDDPFRHPSEVITAAFDSKGERVVTACGDKVARVWNIGLRADSRPLVEGSGIERVLFSPDTNRVLIANSMNVVKLWDLDIGKPIGKQVTLRLPVRFMAFNSDSTMVLLASEAEIEVWNLLEGKQIFSEMREDSVESASFSDRGNLVILDRRGISVWKVESGAAVDSKLPPVSEGCRYTLSPDGDFVLELDKANKGAVRAVESAEISGVSVNFGANSEIVGMSRNAHLIVVIDEMGEMKIWDMNLGAIVGKPLRCPQNKAVSQTEKLWESPVGSSPDVSEEMGIRHVVLSGDGKLLVTVTAEAIRCWNVNSGDLQEIRWISSDVLPAFAPLGKVLRTAHLLTRNELLIRDVRFEEPETDVAAIVGEPSSLLEDWQRRLALVFEKDDSTRLVKGDPAAEGRRAIPILLPGPLYFETNSDQLADGARLGLMKLGYLIQRNPHSLFIIEGHVDRSASLENDLALSRRRADAVVKWLSQSLNLDSSRIKAVGVGSSNLLVESGSSSDRAANNRIEIRVRPPKK